MFEILCWYAFLCLLMTILNSPIVIAVLSLSLGGVVASKLASRYQRKQQIFELRVQGLKTLLDTHASYLHTYLTGQEKETHENLMRLLTNIRYLRVLFPGIDTTEKFKPYNDAALQLNQHFGLKVDAASMSAEDAAITKLHTTLNELNEILVSRLGIHAND